MPFIPRASWPADHRDEVVAGVLVAAVVVVLGYASGIGAPGAGTVNNASPPTTSPSAPSSASPPAAGAPEADTPATDLPGTAGGYQGGGAGGMLPVTDAPGGGSAHEHSPQHGGHAGHPTDPGAPSSPSPSPSESQACQDGEVHLVQPLNGVVAPVTGLLDSLLVPGTLSASASPSSTGAASAPSMCTGPMSSVVSPGVPSAAAEATP